jgi:hypothetical protein
MSEILLAETNPYGSFEAIVEDDGRTVYLYLQSAKQQGAMKAVWVVNRQPAPEEDDFAAMQQGQAPMMPREGTRTPQGHPPFDPERLSFVWFEEGDAVALLHDNAPLAVLPGWAGMNGFFGYSADAVGEEQLAWDLSPALQGLWPRIEESRRYWEWRADADSWRQIQERQLAHLESILGPHQRYWAADGGQYPPRAVAGFERSSLPGVTILVTLGMSAQRMPQVEMHFEDPRPFRRTELALATYGDPSQAAGLLSSTMRFPWAFATWLGDGHTSSFGDPSETPGQSAILLARVPPHQTFQRETGAHQVPAPNLGGLQDVSGDPVQYLWILPIAASERNQAEKDGSAEVIRRMEAQQRGWIWP